MKSNSSAAADPFVRPNPSIAGVWLVAAVFEGTAVFLALQVAPAGGQGWWAGAIICHLLSAGVLLTMGLGKRSPATVVSRDQYRARLYGWLILVLPVMGLAGSLILQLVCDRWIRARGLVEDFQAETEHRVIAPQRIDVQKDLKDYLDEELSVQPVMDILAGTDDNLKRGAIDTLRQIGTPEAIVILKKCLTDTSPEVRYNAHTALTRLDETYIKAIKAATAPLETGRPTPAHHLDYARCCVRYGQSGLLDEDSRHHYLQMARDAFMAAQDKGAWDKALALDLGRLEILLGAWDDAAVHFQSILDREALNVNALIGLAEIHYNRGDAKGLKTIARQMNAALPMEVDSVNEGILLHFWAFEEKAT